jgi:hypothetical protein
MVIARRGFKFSLRMIPGASSVTLPYHGGVADHQFQRAHALARFFSRFA